MKDKISIGEKTISCIVVEDENNDVLVTITPDEIIEKDGYRVALLN